VTITTTMTITATTNITKTNTTREISARTAGSGAVEKNGDNA